MKVNITVTSTTGTVVLKPTSDYTDISHAMRDFENLYDVPHFASVSYERREENVVFIVKYEMTTEYINRFIGRNEEDVKAQVRKLYSGASINFLELKREN